MEYSGEYINFTRIKGERFFYTVSLVNNLYKLDKKIIQGMSPPWISGKWILSNDKFSGEYVYNHGVDRTTGYIFDGTIVWSDKSISVRFTDTDHLINILQGILDYYRSNNISMMQVSSALYHSFYNSDNIIRYVTNNDVIDSQILNNISDYISRF